MDEQEVIDELDKLNAEITRLRRGLKGLAEELGQTRELQEYMDGAYVEGDDA